MAGTKLLAHSSAADSCISADQATASQHHLPQDGVVQTLAEASAGAADSTERYAVAESTPTNSSSLRPVLKSPKKCQAGGKRVKSSVTVAHYTRVHNFSTEGKSVSFDVATDEIERLAVERDEQWREEKQRLELEEEQQQKEQKCLEAGQKTEVGIEGPETWSVDRSGLRSALEWIFSSVQSALSDDNRNDSHRATSLLLRRRCALHGNGHLSIHRWWM